MTAARLLEKAANQGHANACYLLGLGYENGIADLQKDMAKAARLYTKAAGQGSEDALYALAQLYERGEGGPAGFAKQQSYISNFPRAAVEWPRSSRSSASVCCTKPVAVCEATSKKPRHCITDLSTRLMRRTMVVTRTWITPSSVPP